MRPDPVQLLLELKAAADLAFASADVSAEHTAEYDAVVARVDALLDGTSTAISPHPASDPSANS